MRLSDQAIGALMMALQRCLMEQSDITNILKEFHFQLDDSERLVVNNPPMVEAAQVQENNFTVGSD